MGRKSEIRANLLREISISIVNIGVADSYECV